MTNKHTATPYKVAEVYVNNEPNQYHIVDKLFGGIHHAVACDKETAVELVNKLNAHEALVSVCKAWLELEREKHEEEQPHDEDGSPYCTYCLTEQALKQAGE